MFKKINKNEVRKAKHNRIRFTLKGTSDMPRLNVYRSTNEIYAQLIDDKAGKTLCSASSKDKDLEKSQSISGLQQEIEKLKSQIACNDKDRQIAVAEAINVKNDEIVAKDKEIAELNTKLKEAEKDIIVTGQNLKDNYELKLKEKDTKNNKGSTGDACRFRFASRK